MKDDDCRLCPAHGINGNLERATIACAPSPTHDETRESPLRKCCTISRCCTLIQQVLKKCSRGGRRR